MLKTVLIGLFHCGLTVAVAQDSRPKNSSVLHQVNDAFVAIYQEVAPTVVVIKVSKRLSVGDPEAMVEQFGLDHFSSEPDGEPRAPRSPKQFRLPGRAPQSEGSGIVMDTQGHILTANHVVAGADTLVVMLKDGREFPATVVGNDDKTDIAVIKIAPPSSLAVANVGDSDAVKVGQLACAIGTPYNLDYTFTVGVVSAVGRSNLFAADYEDYIQTDASLSPGSSGGPLVNVDGEVVGINTLINGINRGLGFAIPINMANAIGQQLIANGRIVRPWLGIRIDTLRDQSPAVRGYFQGVKDGVVVKSIESAAPAYDSELRPADVITAVDGVAVISARELQQQILTKSIGQALTLLVWRDGKVLEIAVKTGELPHEEEMIAASDTPSHKETAAKPDSLFGLKVQNLTGSIAKRRKLASMAGVLVSAVAADSPADIAGVEKDDVIVEVDSQTVANVKAFKAALSKADSQRGVLLVVDRGGEKLYVVIRR